MEIKTKYNVGDTVYKIDHGEITPITILAITINSSRNPHVDEINTHIEYISRTHINYTESFLHETPEKAVAAMMERFYKSNQ